METTQPISIVGVESRSLEPDVHADTRDALHESLFLGYSVLFFAWLLSTHYRRLALRAALKRLSSRTFS